MQSIRIREKNLHKTQFVLFFVVAFTLLIMPSQLHAADVTFDKTLTWTIPDLSQKPPTAYCAPTAATNALWAFYQNGDNSLIEAAASGIPEDTADNTISLLATAYMLTDPVTGTTTADMVSGLQNYADDYGTAKYTVSLLTAFNTGAGGVQGNGETLWNAMVNELFKCEEVLVIISFTGPAGSHAEVQNHIIDFDGSELSPPIVKNGHAVTMTGYDNSDPVIQEININDPVNNILHVWSPESAPLQVDVAAIPDSILINTPPYASFLIIGAVTISTVPDSDDSGCFISTAAYGSPIDPHVNILRDYLNRFLFDH